MIFGFSDNKFYITVRRWRCSTHRVCLLLCISGASRCAFVDAAWPSWYMCKCKTNLQMTPNNLFLNLCGRHNPISLSEATRDLPSPIRGLSIPVSHRALLHPPPPLWPSCYFFLKAVHYAKSSFLNAHQSSQLSPPSITSNKIYPPADTLINLLSYLSLFVGITIIDGLDLM